MQKMLIRVDEQNHDLGPISWEEAHASPGIMHRAFSIYIFRKNGTEFLVQRRSGKKPLWGLILANSCCSHPRVGEDLLVAAHRRLKEELGFDCDLSIVNRFTYQANDPGGNGSEHEHVTVFRGDVHNDIVITVNKEEAEEAYWIPVAQLQKNMEANPTEYAPWFHQGMKLVLDAE